MAARLLCLSIILLKIIASKCDASACCKTIAGKSGCSTIKKVCPADQSLYKGSCLNTCPIGFYNHDGSCSVCAKHCSSCKDTHCLSCHDLFLTQYGFCNDKCDPLYLKKSSSSRWTRLVNGRTQFEGRVEVYYNGSWGTVCGDTWDAQAAQIVCSELQFGDVVETKIINSARFTSKAGVNLSDKIIWLSGIKCFGDEKSISNCKYKDWGINECSHMEDVAIRCSGPDMSKRCVKSCGDGFRKLGDTCIACPLDCETCNDKAACLTCVDLRYLDGPHCVSLCQPGKYGDSSSLTCKACPLQCSVCLQDTNRHIQCYACRPGYYLSNTKCKKKCSTPVYVPYIRLDGNHTTPYEGLLQIRYQNEWHTVCDDDFVLTNARVICNELGYGEPLGFGGATRYGRGKGKILTSHVSCKGDEKRFIDCDQRPWFSGGCNHNEDIGVTCSVPAFGVGVGGQCVQKCPAGLHLSQKNTCELCARECLTCVDSEERCTTCRHPYVLNGTACLSTCPHGFYLVIADRTCRRCNDKCLLCSGKPDHCLKCRDPYFQSGTQCVTSCPAHTYREDHTCVEECRSDMYRDPATRVCHACQSLLNGCIKCEKTPGAKCLLCDEGYVLTPDNKCHLFCPPGYVIAPANLTALGVTLKLRLSNNGSSGYLGRVEVLHNGVWGTVCDDKWKAANSKVVCSELHLGPPKGDAYIVEERRSPANALTIWLDDVECEGTEKSLSECKHLPWGEHNCQHSENIHLECSSKGSAATCQKHCLVGYFLDNTTGIATCTPCNDGCESCVGSSTNCTKCMDGFHQTITSNCTDQCPMGFYTTTDYRCLPCKDTCWTCEGSADHCTSCKTPRYLMNSMCVPHCPQGAFARGPSDVRLLNKVGPYEGLVQVSLNGIRGFVCDWIATFRDGDVFCRQLYMGRAIKIYLTSDYVHNSSIPIALTHPACVGNESSIMQCISDSHITEHYCSTNPPLVMVKCSGPDTSRSCVANCDTSNGHFVLNNVCQRCMGHCLKCSHTAENCTKCQDGWLLNGTKCVSYCPYGTFLNSVSKMCTPCKSVCLACHDLGDYCTNCPPGTYLKGEACRRACQQGYKKQSGVAGFRLSRGTSGRVERLMNHTWAVFCADGWNFKHAIVVCRQLGYGDPISASEERHYVTGRARLVLNARQCTGREDSIYDCKRSKTKCVHPDYYGNVHCSTFSPKMQCVQTCNIGYYSPAGHDECQPCSSTCLSCAGSADFCTSCNASSFVTSNTCTQVCSRGYYGNLKSRRCEPCDKTCLTCIDGWTNNRCSACSPPYFLKGQLCVDDCYPDYKLMDLVLPVSDPQVRLMNGSGDYEGFVQARINGRWQFLGRMTIFESTRVCQELGYMWAEDVHEKFVNDISGALAWSARCDNYVNKMRQCRFYSFSYPTRYMVSWVRCSLHVPLDYRVCRKLNQRLCRNSACAYHTSCVDGDGSLVPTGSSVCMHCRRGYIGDGDKCLEIAQEPPWVRFVSRNVTGHIGENVRFYDCNAFSGFSRLYPNRHSWTKDGKPLPGQEGPVIMGIRVSNYEAAGRYVCTFRNSLGSASITYNLEVEARPFILSARNLDVVHKSQAMLNCRVVANPPANVTWYYNATKVVTSLNMQLLTNGSLLIKRSAKSHSGNYTCEARNARGSVNATINLRIPDEAGFEKKAADLMVKKGATAKFSCKPLDNDPPFHTTWRRDGAPIKVDQRINVNDQDELIIKDVTQEDCGQYYCVASNGESVVTSVGTLIIQDELPCMHRRPEHVSLPYGVYARFYCHALGSPPPVIHWVRQKTTTPNVLEIANVSVSDVGVYECLAQSGRKSARVHAFLAVDGQYPCPYIAKAPDSTQVNVSADATFFCDGDAVPSFHTTWLFGGNQITRGLKYSLVDRNRTLIIHNVRDADAGQYTCVVRSPYGQLTATAKLRVNVAPVVNYKSSSNKAAIAFGILLPVLLLFVIAYFAWRYRRDGLYPSDVFRDIKQKVVSCFSREGSPAYVVHQNDFDDSADINPFERDQQF